MVKLINMSADPAMPNQEGVQQSGRPIISRQDKCEAPKLSTGFQKAFISSSSGTSYGRTKIRHDENGVCHSESTSLSATPRHRANTQVSALLNLPQEIQDRIWYFYYEDHKVARASCIWDKYYYRFKLVIKGSRRDLRLACRKINKDTQVARRRANWSFEICFHHDLVEELHLSLRDVLESKKLADKWNKITELHIYNVSGLNIEEFSAFTCNWNFITTNLVNLREVKITHGRGGYVFDSLNWKEYSADYVKVTSAEYWHALNYGKDLDRYQQALESLEVEFLVRALENSGRKDCKVIVESQIHWMEKQEPRFGITIIFEVGPQNVVVIGRERTYFNKDAGKSQGLQSNDFH